MKLNQLPFRLRGREYLPVVIGGMGVDISTTELACVASKMGAIGHISDAMVQLVSDRRYGTHHSQEKSARFAAHRDSPDKAAVKFDPDALADSQRRHVEGTMSQKRGDGLIFINIMEKLSMGGPTETLRTRLRAALDGGIDGITLSAGLHTGSLGHIADHPRFHDALIGIIVSSARALKIFLKSSRRYERLPDYIVVEGPLAGGHLGFGEDWSQHNLHTIVQDVLSLLREEGLTIPVIPAGGIFTGTDAVEFIQEGASAVQVATRFVVTHEAGLPPATKQRYFEAVEDDIVVNTLSPTGYLMRMLKSSPCMSSNIKPSCEAFGYMLSKEGKCAYIESFERSPLNGGGKKLPITDKMCLCYHFSMGNCYTCGHMTYRLKDTTNRLADGSYQILSAEHVLSDYLESEDHAIRVPELQETPPVAGPVAGPSPASEIAPR